MWGMFRCFQPEHGRAISGLLCSSIGRLERTYLDLLMTADAGAPKFCAQWHNRIGQNPSTVPDWHFISWLAHANPPCTSCKCCRHSMVYCGLSFRGAAEAMTVMGDVRYKLYKPQLQPVLPDTSAQ